jgi:hypothetical protein
VENLNTLATTKKKKKKKTKTKTKTKTLDSVVYIELLLWFEDLSSWIFVKKEKIICLLSHKSWAFTMTYNTTFIVLEIQNLDIEDLE